MKNNDDLKPCINCEKLCEIFPVQLGDFATLTYPRVCSEGCMFMLAYEFLHGLYEHKNFQNSLFDKENKEDKELKEKHQDEALKMSLERMQKSFKENANLLSDLAPSGIIDIFKDFPIQSNNSGITMRFIKPKKKEEIS